MALELADRRVKFLFEAEQQRHDDGGGSCFGGRAEHGHRSERERRQQRELGRHAEVALLASADDVARHDEGADDEHAGREHGEAIRQRERREDAAAESRDRKRAQPGQPLAALLVAGLPAALEPDDQADAERDCEAVPEGFVHGSNGPLRAR